MTDRVEKEIWFFFTEFQLNKKAPFQVGCERGAFRYSCCKRLNVTVKRPFLTQPGGSTRATGWGCESADKLLWPEHPGRHSTVWSTRSWDHKARELGKRPFSKFKLTEELCLCVLPLHTSLRLQADAKLTFTFLWRGLIITSLVSGNWQRSDIHVLNYLAATFQHLTFCISFSLNEMSKNGIIQLAGFGNNTSIAQEIEVKDMKQLKGQRYPLP